MVPAHEALHLAVHVSDPITGRTGSVLDRDVTRRGLGVA